MALQSDAVPAHREFTRCLNRVDGLSLGLSIPVGGFALIGYSIGILGAGAAMPLWGVTQLGPVPAVAPGPQPSAQALDETA